MKVNECVREGDILRISKYHKGYCESQRDSKDNGVKRER